jgi:hypothetical protein
MVFTTDNPTWPKIPFVDQILSGARKELFQIRVSGTVQDPKLTAGTLNTVSTTIDEVFNPASK